MEKNRRDFLKIMTSSALTASLVPLGVCYGEKKPKPGAEGVSQKSRVEEAHSLLGEYDNCCTSVLAAYSPELGMEKDLAVRATRGMPGIGLLGNVCGAVSGATLVIGLKMTNENNIHNTEARNKTYENAREFVARFEEHHSSIECRELLGCDISTREKLQAATKDNAFANCPKFVESAVNILDDILNNERTQ
ncbi:MAG: C-GCAxxG-C-C family protein [Planctomycetota bacterium]|jgi:C_GCAxxG_C_C family probable redox protein